MTNPEDYEYNGRRSKYPPVWQILVYFSFGVGCFWIGFDRLAEFTRFEEAAITSAIQPTIRVHWLEKLLYEAGGKYLVLGLTLAFGLLMISYAVSRLVSWFRLRNGGRV